MSESKNRAPAIHPVCVLTGGTSGIGLDTAKRFARAGYRLVTCGRDQGRLDKARHEISVAGGGSEVIAIELNLARPHEVGQLVDRAAEALPEER